MDASACWYTGFTLRFYDFWVLRISNQYAWNCPTQSFLIPFFTHSLNHSSSHLDIGVGTGYYLAHPSTLPLLNKLKCLALLDLNPKTLQVASARLQQVGYTREVNTIQQSILEPLPASMHGSFTSISLFYVLHCLQGSFPEKAQRVLATLTPALSPAPDSTLYGATILNIGVPHNWFGRALMRFYRRKGIFGESQDSVDGLREGLNAYFDNVEIDVVGTVALFSCKGPK